MKSAQANTKGQQKFPVVGVREKKMLLPPFEVARFTSEALLGWTKAGLFQNQQNLRRRWYWRDQQMTKKNDIILFHSPPSDYYINTSMVRWDHCCCFDCSAAFNQDNNVWFVCDFHRWGTHQSPAIPLCSDSGSEDEEEMSVRKRLPLSYECFKVEMTVFPPARAPRGRFNISPSSPTGPNHAMMSGENSSLKLHFIPLKLGT